MYIPCRFTCHPLPVTLFILLGVTTQAVAQEGDTADITDLSEIEFAAELTPESASPDRVPLTVWVETYAEGTRRGGGGSTTGESDRSMMIYTETAPLISTFWNLHVAWIDSEGLIYSLGGYLARGGDPGELNDGMTAGLGLKSEAHLYFSGIPFHGFVATLGTSYATAEFGEDENSVDGQVFALELTGGYTWNLGSVALSLYTGAAYPLSGGERSIPWIYNGDGGLAPAGGFDVGMVF